MNCDNATIMGFVIGVVFVVSVGGLSFLMGYVVARRRSRA